MSEILGYDCEGKPIELGSFVSPKNDDSDIAYGKGVPGHRRIGIHIVSGKTILFEHEFICLDDNKLMAIASKLRVIEPPEEDNEEILETEKPKESEIV